MIDTHSADCSCSYCAGDDKLHFGLNIPRDWFHPVSWYAIKYWHNRYIRWTNNWMRIFKRK